MRSRGLLLRTGIERGGKRDIKEREKIKEWEGRGNEGQTGPCLTNKKSSPRHCIGY